jgi:hypothetical protein
MKLNVSYIFLIGCILILSCASKHEVSTQANPQITSRTFKLKPMFPVIINCRDAISSSCLENEISNLIIDEARKKDLLLLNDTLQIGIKFMKTGDLELLLNESSNKNLKNLSSSLVNSIDMLAPAYSKRENRYTTHTYYWYVIIKDNALFNPSDY